jgi:hypothetical protein
MYQTSNVAAAPAPADKSEISYELDSLTSAAGRLADAQAELARRLEPVSRGKPPSETSTRGQLPQPVLGSHVARQIQIVREQVTAVCHAIDEELAALAV